MADRDPNQLEFSLTCQHCGFTAFSHGSLKHGELKCKKFCVRCGCCRDIYFDKEKLSKHLNQLGVSKRPSAISPSDYLATSHVVVTRTTTTATMTHYHHPSKTTTETGRIPTARDLGPPVRPSWPLSVSSGHLAPAVASVPSGPIHQAPLPDPQTTIVDFEVCMLKGTRFERVHLHIGTVCHFCCLWLTISFPREQFLQWELSLSSRTVILSGGLCLLGWMGVSNGRTRWGCVEIDEAKLERRKI